MDGLNQEYRIGMFSPDGPVIFGSVCKIFGNRKFWDSFSETRVMDRAVTAEKDNSPRDIDRYL